MDGLASLVRLSMYIWGEGEREGERGRGEGREERERRGRDIRLRERESGREGKPVVGSICV
eukprot:352115-Amorphochlora_amoeboformis.AAC.1